MEKLKVGSILKNKDGSEAMVVGMKTRNFILLAGNKAYEPIEALLDGGWIIPKEEKWKPKKGENYYYPILDQEHWYGITKYNDRDLGINRQDRLYERGLLFRTREEAEAKALKIKQILSE